MRTGNREKPYEKRSSLAEISKEAHALVESGAREIILTGINLGAWGKLSPLINELSKINNLFRIRLSSIEPQYVSDELIRTIANNPKVCHHLHIPLQSGDDKILKLMNRKYNVAEYAALIDKIRNSVPDCGITTDVITGFPGEGEKEFRNTVETIEKIGFSRLHVFTYSKRDLTAAAKMTGQVEVGIKKERYALLNGLRAKLMRTFAEKYIEKEVEILVERKGEGLTSNYIRVRFDDTNDSSGKLHRLILTEQNLIFN
ncbi:MAG: radical SAM protein [Candidatus Margulisiibacteriota bacterium]